MTLTQWLNQTFTHVTLSDSYVGKNNSVVKIPEINIDLTAGLFSTDSMEEYEELCMKYAPVGTIRDHITEDWYRDKLLRGRNILTKRALTESNTRLAKKYLDILAVRDKSRWQKEGKEKSVTVTDTNKNINIEFKVKD